MKGGFRSTGINSTSSAAAASSSGTSVYSDVISLIWSKTIDFFLVAIHYCSPLSSLETVAAICLHRPSSSGLVSENSSYNLDQSGGACLRSPSFLRCP